MVDWVIYYGDGTQFTSDDGTPDEAPSHNVACIAQSDTTVGRALVARRDFYCYHDGEWYGHDLFGLFDWLTRSGLMKAGRTLPNKEYGEIIAMAMVDDRLPRKSAKYREEP